MPQPEAITNDRQPIIHVQDLSVHYGAYPALEQVTLSIAQGECVLVTGPSGCGKSTLARVLCGLIPQAIPAQVTGQVALQGSGAAALDILNQPVPVVAQQVGMVFQRPATQLFHLRVEQEVAFGPRNLGLSEDEVQSRTEWALAATGTAHLRSRRPDELSGGQKQCVAIAAVLAMRPGVLILDEPTASLDVSNTRMVMDTLQTLRQQHGLTIVLIEHRLAEALQIASRLILMDSGRIVAGGAPEQLLADQALIRRFGIRRPAGMPPEAWEALVVSDKENPRGSAPPAEDCAPVNTSEAQPNGALLELRQVSAGYQRRAVIHNVDLAIYPSDFVALVGENGAGKSTLGLAACGLLKPTAGQVRFAHGKRPRPGLDAAMLFQNPEDQLLCDTVDEEVAYAPRNFDRHDASLHEQILRETGLWALRERNPHQLSVGQQQRAALAACLAVMPRLLILDEPTLGQDWGHLQQMMNFLAQLNRQGTAILLITHDYKLIHRYARRLIIMQDGRIARTGRVDGSHSTGKNLSLEQE